MAKNIRWYQKQIQKKLERGKSAAEIAEELEIEKTVAEEIIAKVKRSAEK